MIIKPIGIGHKTSSREGTLLLSHIKLKNTGNMY